jgi:Tfp pilus assembly protein PilV
MKKLLGIGLLELMLSLAIIAVLLLAATQYFKTVDTSRRVDTAIKMLQQTISAAEDYKMSSSSNDYSGISMDVLAKRGLINFASANTNPWGGNITVSATTDAKQITLSMTSITTGCSQLVDAVKNFGTQGGTCVNNTFSDTYPAI